MKKYRKIHRRNHGRKLPMKTGGDASIPTFTRGNRQAYSSLSSINWRRHWWKQAWHFKWYCHAVETFVKRIWSLLRFFGKVKSRGKVKDCSGDLRRVPTAFTVTSCVINWWTEKQGTWAPLSNNQGIIGYGQPVEKIVWNNEYNKLAVTIFFRINRFYFIHIIK